MLLQFSVSNYRCFRKRVTLHCAASGQDKSLPDNVIERKLPGVSDKRWLKGIALYGANASGKSTVLSALRAFQQLVLLSAKITDRKEPIAQIEPFALCPGQSPEPTAFAVVFVMQGIRYEYRVAATRERIWHESLRAVPKSKEQLWFSRDYHPESDSYHFSPERPSGFKRDPQLEGYTLPNVLFLSKAIANNRTDLEPIFLWLTAQLRFLDLSAGNLLGLNYLMTAEQVASRSPLSLRILELMRHADLGIVDARITELFQVKSVEEQLKIFPPEIQTKLRESKIPIPELAHRGTADAAVPLPWSSESVGTQRFFSLVGPWLDILQHGYTVCIDELETSMHPLMVRELLRLVFSAQANARGAQLLFTTHNPLLLDPTLLRRDQIWFTDKDEQGEAHLYPLTDYQPRKGESLIRGYLSGRYGAVPFLPDGLLGAFGGMASGRDGKSRGESSDE
ncbi:MAG: ATP-binding protein [Myxococcales bacterium]|nr:ATP-binding protein [Myxococcales bacterium]